MHTPDVGPRIPSLNGRPVIRALRRSNSAAQQRVKRARSSPQSPEDLYRSVHHRAQQEHNEHKREQRHACDDGTSRLVVGHNATRAKETDSERGDRRAPKH
jgi:hypothetical protein